MNMPLAGALQWDGCERVTIFDLICAEWNVHPDSQRG